jgi:hypothetical protein
MLHYISYPVRLENGALERTDEVTALLQVCRIAARTPPGSWKGNGLFGFRELLGPFTQSPELLRSLTQSVNESLRDLGIVSFAIKKFTAGASDVNFRTLEMEVVDLRSTQTFSLSVPVET